MRPEEASSVTSPFILAVCAEMVFTVLPFVERVRRIDGLAFQVAAPLGIPRLNLTAPGSTREATRSGRSRP
jgi:hypothetical protein